MRRVAELSAGSPPLNGVLTQAVAVEEDLPAGADFPERRLTHTVIMHGLAGSGRWLADDVPLALPRGALAVLARGQRNAETVGATTWTSRYLMLQGPWFDGLDRLLAERPGRALVLTRPPAVAVQALARAVGAALEQPAGWQWSFTAALAELLGSLQDSCRMAEATDLPARVSNLIGSEPDRRWTTREIADGLGLSLSTLAHAFPRVGGMPLAAWLRRGRLARAQMLVHQGLPVVAVAERLGFANPFHFSRAYSRQWGHPPSLDRGSASPLRGSS